MNQPRPLAPLAVNPAITPLHIIIAEDDALIGMYLDDLLSGMGHTVCAVARTEAEAIAAATCRRPDLMIVDGNLEGGS